MNTVGSNSAHDNWRRFYQAAILELDSSNLPRLIAEAEQVIIQRARELFSEPGDHVEEKEALDDAIYCLRALRGTLKRPVAAETTSGSYRQMPLA
jgi:hypothetical protein